MEKIEGKLFFMREKFSFFEIKTKRSEVLEVQIEEKENFDRGKESKPEIFFIPGSLTFQPYRCIFSICWASTHHRSSLPCHALITRTSFMDAPFYRVLQVAQASFIIKNFAASIHP